MRTIRFEIYNAFGAMEAASTVAVAGNAEPLEMARKMFPVGPPGVGFAPGIEVRMWLDADPSTPAGSLGGPHLTFVVEAVR